MRPIIFNLLHTITMVELVNTHFSSAVIIFAVALLRYYK